MKKTTHKILIGVQTLALTLMAALPAQAAINVGGPQETSGSVVTLHPYTNSSGTPTYSVVYPGTTGTTSVATVVSTTGTVSATPGNSNVPGNSGTSASGTTPAPGTSVVSLSSQPYYGTGAAGPVSIPINSGNTPSQITVGQAYSGGSSEVSLSSILSSSSAPVTPTSTPTPTSTSTSTSTSTPATASTPLTIAPATSLTPDEQTIVDMVNQERTAAGLKPLQVDLRLVGVAQTKAQDMQTNQYFGHTSPTYGSPWAMMQLAGLTVGWAGENIAGNDSATGAMAAWMASPEHRANILDPNFTDIGVGVANGSPYNIYVQEFLQE